MCRCCWGRGAILRTGARETRDDVRKTTYLIIEDESQRLSGHCKREPTPPWPSHVAQTLCLQPRIPLSILRYSMHDQRQLETARY